MELLGGIQDDHVLNQPQHPEMLPCLKILVGGALFFKISSFIIEIPIIEMGKNLLTYHVSMSDQST